MLVEIEQIFEFLDLVRSHVPVQCFENTEIGIVDHALASFLMPIMGSKGALNHGREWPVPQIMQQGRSLDDLAFAIHPTLDAGIISMPPAQGLQFSNRDEVIFQVLDIKSRRQFYGIAEKQAFEFIHLDIPKKMTVNVLVSHAEDVLLQRGFDDIRFILV